MRLSFAQGPGLWKGKAVAADNAIAAPPAAAVAAHPIDACLFKQLLG